MAGWTNAGKEMVLNVAFRDVAVQTNYYLTLATDATAPTYATATMADVTEIVDAQSGYTAGGYSITPGVTDFDVNAVVDTDDWRVQLKDIVWTASGGPIPSSGGDARYALLCDDNATPASKVVYAYWDLVSDRSVSDGQTLTLQDVEIRINES